LDKKGTGFIGCGAIGSAFIKGILNGEKLTSGEIWAYDYREEIMENLKKNHSIQLATSHRDVLDNCSTVFLAVKHTDYPLLFKQIAPFIRAQLIVSVGAGISISYIKENLGENVQVIRLMPNTPCLIGKGVIAIAAGEGVDQGTCNRIENLVASLGTTSFVKEADINAVTGLSGSGPAYLYLFLEALVEGGVKAGLDRNIAEVFSLQTIKGAAEMVEQNGKSPADLKSVVTSPGGTTSYGLHVLEERALRAAVSDAVGAACKRAWELEEKE